MRQFFLKIYFQFAIFCFHGFIKLTKSWYIGLNGFHWFEAKSFLFWCWFEIGFLLRFGYGAGYPPIRFGLGWRLNGGLGWNGLSGGNWIWDPGLGGLWLEYPGRGIWYPGFELDIFDCVMLVGPKYPEFVWPSGLLAKYVKIIIH